ncbi:MAG: DUF192 domain-containing protein [Opitutaceae bacterium]
MPKLPRFLACSLLVSVATATAVALSACAEEKPAEEKTAADYFPVKIGERVVRLQFAVLPNEQQRGLMERTTLGADDGMIFVYQQPQQMSFWMRNTLVPLDIGFFDAKGELREVRQMFPRDERSVKSHGAELQFAIEMNQNWYRDRGVKPGARLDMAAVKAAMKERGFEPRRFGIE